MRRYMYAFRDVAAYIRRYADASTLISSTIIKVTSTQFQDVSLKQQGTIRGKVSNGSQNLVASTSKHPQLLA